MRSWRKAARKVSVCHFAIAAELGDLPRAYLGHQPATARRPAMAPRHVGLGPSLVDEDQPFGINPTLILPPLRPPPGNVGAVLFGGVQGFF